MHYLLLEFVLVDELLEVWGHWFVGESNGYKV